QALWLLCGGLFVSSWLLGSLLRVLILRLFGARIAPGVVIKPHVRVKFLAPVDRREQLDRRGCLDRQSRPCVDRRPMLYLQDAYLCTGSHDWSKETFDLVTQPIVIEDGAWICAKTTTGPGVRGRCSCARLGGDAGPPSLGLSFDSAQRNY